MSGVAGTDIVGGLKREIRVNLDGNALEKHQLSLPGVVKKLRDENVEQFGGRVNVGPREFIARTTANIAPWKKSDLSSWLEKTRRRSMCVT